MIGRWAKPEEKHDLQVLWSRVFGDGPDVTDLFFRRFPPERHTRVIPAGYGITSMANWLPVTLRAEGKAYSGAYVYAVATAPERRGEGLGSALVEELDRALADAGLDFACLCPASTRLYDFYAALGYETAFFCGHFHAAPAGEASVPTRMDAMEYLALRRELLTGPFCDWGAAAVSYLQATGTRFYSLPSGCAAVSLLPDGTARISELIAQTPSAAAGALCRALGAERAEVFTPGTDLPRGMLKWFTFGQKISPAHLGFAFD